MDAKNWVEQAARKTGAVKGKPMLNWIMEY